MNTERPDNEDATGASDDVPGVGDAVKGAVEGPEVEGADEGAVSEEAGRSETAGPQKSEPEETEPEASDVEAASSEHPTPVTSEVRQDQPETSDASEVSDRTDDEHPARSRSRSPLVIASVAAAVLLVGGGGAYLASSSSSSGGSGDGTGSAASGGGTPPPLALDGYATGGTNGIASGEPNPYGVTYKAQGTLPAGPGSAAVYSAEGQVAKDDVARLAKALGVVGTPVAEGQYWKVGGQDGSGPSLQVNRTAPGLWTFNRYAPGTDNCTDTLKCAQDPGTSATDPVSVAVAKQAAAPILKAVGQDDAKVDASQLMGAQRVVNAEPLVGGLPTHGWTTGLTVSAQGEVVGGSGQLAAPMKGDVYPVLSAQKTLALLNAAPGTDHRMGIGGCASPVPLKDRLEAPCGQSTGAPTQASATVEHAVFGLAAHSVDGKQALVPSWLFEVRQSGTQDSFTVTYPAIDPKYLASAGTPTPTPTSTATAAPHDVKADGYSADGKTLTVAFTGGVCADYRTTAAESSDKVTVTVTATPWPNKVCIMIAKIYHQNVELKAPLGDRKVVGSDGKAIPVEKSTRPTAGAGPSLAR
ncbi:hypothetical protein SAMN05216489_03110 [Streptomyces sp. 3213]|uniref:hypothetical protein n=1 Tax=Streptomyces sp. 3213.3 TaxID=1855348 RepID=UPI00089D21DF|nr:hypothetical protein [Streptomyces sp. 3213.3]SED31083.1 hypothetical protein SAMN05216489_03110 [Streptomyces sp. 3213] [Streptomyces sp. 3213.3]